ncbi:helix-turn-helix domain-containing protein [Brachybacterium sp. NBEC-018]|uniref:helix-turn-helix domain-containing protein n=1 Tax=Brachybacterium sp. NBEC-018 TaxID=2996004 RepID=UPI0021756132|nr:helix-turn-helix domain-containing protein [Brachybacterium sp. NBEC-018]UVY83217.1 helix-turn-helix domain-containing protein [Brachybacterium sp. NBEC-018]
MAGKRLSRDTAEAIADAYRAGQTMKQIAQDLQLHRTTISETLRREGVPKRQKGLTLGQAKQAEHLYATGDSLATIGRRLNVDATTIRNVLLRRGISLRDPMDVRADNCSPEGTL